MNFGNLIGRNVQVLIPSIHKTNLQDVKIHGVEAGGLWVEYQTITNQILSAIGEVHGRTPIFFFPYHQISFAWTDLDEVALAEPAFGVTPED